jgi:hypothetical protein
MTTHACTSLDAASGITYVVNPAGVIFTGNGYFIIIVIVICIILF